MTFSIRKFLLINLLLAIIVTTTLTAIGDYYLDRKVIEEHLDALLSQATLSFKALLGGDPHDANLDNIQQALKELPDTAKAFIEKEFGTTTERQFRGKFQFQIWNNKGKLILHSANAPKLPLSTGDEGFGTKIIDNIPWRVFTTYDKELGLTIVVAERTDQRKELAIQITKDDIYVLAIMFPISGLLIWFILGRGLGPLNRVTDEVAHRAPSYLEPVDLKNVPIEIKPLVDELNKLFLRLQDAFDREKRFAGDAAHELRTPLAALKTQAQVALKAERTERTEHLTHIIEGVDRSAHVVEQLLTLSRLAPGAGSLDDFKTINLPKLAAEVVAQIVPLALDKKIEIDLTTDNEETSILGNSTVLSVLIRNLVDNAIRYTPKGGEINVAVRETKKYATLSVTDNGPGIPAKLRARVFERFYRVLGNKSPGSGLGLAIVKQIANLHQATIKLGSPASGKGLHVEVKFTKV